jgi:hypothetical protein
MSNEDIIEVVRDAMQRKFKVLLLDGERVRLYNAHGVTMRTIALENYDDETQMEVIDLILPFLE